MYRLLNGYRLEVSYDRGKTWTLVCKVQWSADMSCDISLDYNTHASEFFKMLVKLNMLDKLDKILKEFLTTNYFPGAREFVAYIKGIISEEVQK